MDELKYCEEENLQEYKSNRVPIYEQETHISYMRDEDFLIIYY